jgi:predicted RNA-binding Zn-ribbon protein involved in translation (DUF1610 family)
VLTVILSAISIGFPVCKRLESSEAEMRSSSVYQIGCVGCGRTVESESTRFACPHCKRQIEIHWREETRDRLSVRRLQGSSEPLFSLCVICDLRFAALEEKNCAKHVAKDRTR